MIHTCLICGEEFHTQLALVKKGWGKYCSIACKAAGQRKKDSRVTITCEICGVEFKVYPCRVGRRNYCSRPCQAMGQKKHHSGEDCVHWKGGITPAHRATRASTEYKRWREAVFARDNWTCQDCGAKSRGNLHAHHIFSFAEFSEHQLEVWNGVSLCLRCHQRLHPEVKLKVGNTTNQTVDDVQWQINAYEPPEGK